MAKDQDDPEPEAELVLVAGEPIKEPVSQHGPFVMTSREELNQAFQDYYNCQNGFEQAKDWKSIRGNN